MYRYVSIYLAVFLIILCAGDVHASKESSADSMQKALDERTERLISGLDENKMKQFQLIRHTHGVIRAVEYTQDMIADAIQSCGQSNAEMKDVLDQRHTYWRQAILPTQIAAKERLKDMILSQSFSKPQIVYEYLSFYDEVTRAQKSQTQPIHNRSDCYDLLKKMDRKRGDIIELMTKTIGLDKPLRKE